MREWYLIYCKANQEQIAKENLERQGYTAFLPRVRQRRRLRGRYQERVEAMFPRYLFINLDDTNQNWKPIRSTVGVANLVNFGGAAAKVPPDLVRSLQDKAEKDGVCALPPPKLRRGTRVRILDGILSGYEGLFDTQTSRERVSLLLEIAGRTVPVRFSTNSIEVAD